MFRRFCSGLLPLTLVLSQPTAAAAEPAQLDNPAALAHVKSAKAYYDEGDFAAAAKAYAKAYSLEASLAVLFNWAHATRLSGDCPRAIELYNRFIASDPGEDLPARAKDAIAGCEGVEAEGAAQRDTGSNDDGNDISDATDDGEVKPAYKDWLGATLLGAGIAAAIGGGVLLAVGKRQVDESGDQNFEGEYQDEITSGRAKYTAGAVVLGLGGALIVGGIIRYSVLTARNKKKQSASSAQLVPGPGLGLALRGRF